MKPYAFGIDIGGTTVKMGLFKTTGELDESWEIPTRKEDDGGHILEDIAESIKSKLTERRLTSIDVEGIGIDVPGPILQDKIVNRCVNLGWGVVDVSAEMERLTGIANIKVANDANAAALGEMWKGGGEGHNDVVMITLGTGVGGGIILGGKIVSGNYGAAGEIGHVLMNRREKQACGCGKKGHLEQYASATGIVRKAKEILAESEEPSALRELGEVTSKDVYDYAKKGDALAVKVTDFVGNELGIACALISCVIDPEIYVIGGGVSKAGEYLLDSIQEHYKKYAFHASEGTHFALAKLGNDAGMYGSVKMVLE